LCGPPSPPSDIHENIWISFRGTQRPDGVVVAAVADFKKNTITQVESELRNKWVYDSTAGQKANRDTAMKAIDGIDLREITPYDDEAMQTRVSAIGAKLVPKYQSDLHPRTLVWSRARVARSLRYIVIDSDVSRHLFHLKGLR
jgi:hypothetical protein